MAAAAEGLGGLTAVKAAADALGPGRVENVVQALVENVAQGQPALAVQTARDHGAVAQHAQLAAQIARQAKVLGTAHAFQLDTDYHKRRPGRGQAEKKEAV